MPVGIVNKTSLWCTRILYTLWFVNFDRFCQPSSITDADEKCNMARIRDLLMIGTAFKSVINNKLKVFPKCLREEQKDCRKKWSMNPSHGSLKKFNLSTLSTSNVSDDGMEKPAPSSRNHGGLSSSRGRDERPSWTIKHNRSRSNSNGYRLRSREEGPESARLCGKICKYCSWHLYVLLCRVWHLCDLPCGVYALFRLISIAIYVLKSLSIGFLRTNF